MQYWHICCFSMDCINSYEPSNLQDLRHWSHVCGFSFNWLCWWSFRWCVRVAECTHYVHLIGFSLMWVLRCDGWWNDLKQWSHLCGFLPLCVTRWTLRILAPVAERSHIVHLGKLPKKKRFFGKSFPNVGGWGGWFPNKVQTPQSPQITPKIAFFDPNFTKRSPKSHKSPGVGW